MTTPQPDGMELERALMLDTVRVTEQAAQAASRWAGKGDRTEVDRAGTSAMRRVLNELHIAGQVVIGEGEMDEAPMLYIGEWLGRASLGHGEAAIPVDIALDPVEGTTVTSSGLPNGVAVIAISEAGGLMHAPDIYMDKPAVPPPAAGRVSLDWPVEANAQALAMSLERRPGDLIGSIRQVGARVKLIGEGDVIAAMAAAVRGTGVHALMGWAGRPRGSSRRRP